jgi:hypothetical protein
MRLQFDPRGWVQSPESEELSLEFMRLLGVTQEGGSTVSECFLAASRIDSRDQASWYREWRRLADASNERACNAHNRGNLLTAQSNWLRAINYYHACAFGLDSGNKETAGRTQNDAGMRASLHRTFEACRRDRRDSLVGEPFTGRLFPACPLCFRYNAGGCLYGRTRTSKGGVSLQDGPLCPRSRNVNARSPSR